MSAIEPKSAGTPPSPQQTHSREGVNGDLIFKLITAGCCCVLVLLVVLLFLQLVSFSLPSIQRFGIGFLFSTEWNPVTGEYGALPSIYGTLVTTLIAMVIAVPLSLLIALFLVELAPPTLSGFFGGAVELLAAVPSIIYGMWGLFVLAPMMSDYVQPFLMDYLGFIPFFDGPPIGIGLMTAGLILALMVLPFITSVTREALKMVPPMTKESAYGVGSTTWETTWFVSLPYCKSAVIGGLFLGFGRAIGETMAVTYVIGNRQAVTAALFNPGATIASTLANDFAEADTELKVSVLMELGLILFVMSISFQFLAQLWLHKTGPSK